MPDVPSVYGKRGPDGAPLLAEHGELDPDVIAVALANRLGVPAPARRPRRSSITLALTPRTPYFCSGCPHNTSTKPADGSLVGGGIGCHAMVLMMDPKQVGEVTGLTQMGGEGTQWIGMAPFVEARHLVQNLGDGTFHHSGSERKHGHWPDRLAPHAQGRSQQPARPARLAETARATTLPPPATWLTAAQTDSPPLFPTQITLCSEPS